MIESEAHTLKGATMAYQMEIIITRVNEDGSEYKGPPYIWRFETLAEDHSIVVARALKALRGGI